MTSPDIEAEHVSAEQDDSDQMAKFGITRVPVDHFRYKELRFSTLQEAIAEAKRQQHAASPDRYGRTQLR
jgi:hypothetical protein